MDLTFSEEDRGLVENLMPAVRRVLSVEDVATGGTKEGYAARFRGRLVMDSQTAYERLEPAFKKQGTTLVFREEAGRHVILAIPGLIQPVPSNPWINLLMFGLTLATVIYVGIVIATSYNAAGIGQTISFELTRDLPLALLYAASLLGILVAHEFGHYFAARFHKTATSLPYFIPFPALPFGTLGAFIRLKQPARNKRVLLDIGLAGPLAGMIVAIPVLLIGLSLSKVGTLPATPTEAVGQVLEGNSLLYLAAKFVVTGEFLPAPVDYGGVSPLLYWGRYLLLGLPVPFGGKDVLLHPIAWAGWAGLLITAINLIPAGQLDGGHTIYTLLGRRAVKLWPFIIVGLVILGIVWQGWLIWAALIFFLGRTYAQPLEDITPLNSRRRAVAIFGLILFVLVFTPIPLRFM